MHRSPRLAEGAKSTQSSGVTWQKWQRAEEWAEGSEKGSRRWTEVKAVHTEGQWRWTMWVTMKRHLFWQEKYEKRELSSSCSYFICSAKGCILEWTLARNCNFQTLSRQSWIQENKMATVNLAVPKEKSMNNSFISVKQKEWSKQSFSIKVCCRDFIVHSLRKMLSTFHKPDKCHHSDIFYRRNILAVYPAIPSLSWGWKVKTDLKAFWLVSYATGLNIE